VETVCGVILDCRVVAATDELDIAEDSFC